MYSKSECTIFKLNKSVFSCWIVNIAMFDKAEGIREDWISWRQLKLTNKQHYFGGNDSDQFIAHTGRFYPYIPNQNIDVEYNKIISSLFWKNANETFNKWPEVHNMIAIRLYCYIDYSWPKFKFMFYMFFKNDLSFSFENDIKTIRTWIIKAYSYVFMVRICSYN